MLSRLIVIAALVGGCNSATPVASGDAAAPSSDTVTLPDGPSCGLRAGGRGMTRRTIMAGGLERSYIVYLPELVDPAEPVPLVIVAHGYTMSGEAMFNLTEYAGHADTEHIAVAFPDGQGGPDSTGAPWNVGANVCPSTAGTPPSAPGDDFAFIDAIKADIALDQCLDLEHLYATGFSMGGYLSHHIGCMRDDIRAVAPASGGTHDLASCTVGHKPIIIFHGISDGLVPNGCDDPGGFPVTGVEPSARAWAAKNGCGTTTTTQLVAGGSCAYYDGCPADGQVAVCTFVGMGHCWAGAPASAGTYACPGYASATALQWQFFKQHAW